MAVKIDTGISAALALRAAVSTLLSHLCHRWQFYATTISSQLDIIWLQQFPECLASFANRRRLAEITDQPYHLTASQFVIHSFSPAQRL